MILKKLELTGFKSFAKRTVLDFPSGITAIVGPNGSGKSNIVDAIRWVLAEQSFKSLRSRKGEDVIFHGGAKRSSLPSAKVSLELDSGGKSSLDLDEVVLARQVNSKGQNSYFLNQRKVRLVDLSAFLASSGIGASSFRVLSQGMSDMLITLGPKEFREFIEDAAGVREFQDKKHRSLLKLRSTRQNLEKVSALLAELSPRLKFLKREHGKFSRRGETEEKLKSIAIKLFSARYNSLVKKQKNIIEKKKVFQNNLAGIKKDLDKFRTELFSFEDEFQKSQDLQKINQDIHELEEKKYSIKRELLSAEGKIELEKERIKQTFPVSKDYLNSYLKDMHSLAKGMLVSANAKKDLKILLDKINNIIKELNEGRKKDTKKIEETIKQAKEKVAKLKKEVEQVNTVLDKLTQERDKGQESLGFDKAKLREKENLYRQKNEEVQNIQITINSLSLEEEKVKIRQEQLSRDIKNLEIITLADVISVKTEKVEDENKLEEEMWRLKRNIDHIGTIDPTVEGEYEGVKERYEFLETESGDLQKTLKSLESIIKDLNKQIEVSFKNTLVKMSDAFNSYFRLMFGGGKAVLRPSTWADTNEKSFGKTPRVKEEHSDRETLGVGEEDFWDKEAADGIEIDVSLPGKKIKGLNNLSGGERTLVSIALLFALVSVRTPPFLVLDEIDAALDEVNSQRFIKLLHEMTKKTQFIIITHNRETMRGADALYGVSGKDGVSHLLSIKLEPSKQVKIT